MPAETLHAALQQGEAALTLALTLLLELEWLREHAPNIAHGLQDLQDMEPSAKRRAVLLGVGYMAALAAAWKGLSPGTAANRRRLRFAMQKCGPRRLS